MALALVASGFSASFAQDLELPLIVSAQGKSFVIGNGGRSDTYWTGQLREERIRLSTDDMLQTGKGDFVQVSLRGSDALLYLAENTSIIYTGNPAKQDTFTLVYGRIRIRSQGGARPIVVLNGNSSAAISGGDVNIEYIYAPAAPATQKPVLRLSVIPSALKDNVTVLPKAGDPSFGKLTLAPGETLLVDGFTFNTERVPLDNAIVDYWNFVSDPNYAATMGGMEWNPEMSDKEDPVGVRPFDFQQSTLNLKTGAIIAGLSLVLSGIVMQSTAHFLGDSMGSNANLVYSLGYLPIGIGSFTLLAAYFYKTPARPNVK
jgi:hypothetical protein